MDPVTPYKDIDKSKKKQVETMFDNIAPSYDRLNHLLSAGIDIIWRKNAISHLKKFQPKIIMDMATGTGDFAFEALKLKPEKIYAVDLSAKMLEIGRKKSIERNANEVVEFIKGDAENLDFEDNSIDAITVGFGVRNFENLPRGLSELCRILRPGGKIVILEISKPTNFPLKQVFNIYFHNILPFIGKTISKDNSAYTYLPESVEAFPENEEFQSILKECGFSETSWLPLTFGICSMYVGTK